MTKDIEKGQLFHNIRELILITRQKIYSHVNTAMVRTYFEIGRMIVEDEQKGKSRAEYGKAQLKVLSKQLSREFGRGFSERNLEYMRNFYLIYSKSQTVSAKSNQFKLSWSHYVFLIRLEKPIRQFYEIESIENNWSLRELKRQFNSSLYERLALTKDKAKLFEMSARGQIIEKPRDLIKDPYVFEFLGLEENSKYSESEFESKLISNLEKFLLELGKGFTFVARQQRISFSEQYYYIDLVFYNRILKCFVVIDLKIGELKHQSLGQLQMYVNYYDRKIKNENENNTIGILLCTDKEDAVVKMTLPENNRQIFASQYRLYLPSRKELVQQLKVAF